MAVATIRNVIPAIPLVSGALYNNLASSLIWTFEMGPADGAFARSTQVVMHHLPQPERQVRHAVHRRDHFENWQLRNQRQRVGSER